MKGKISKDARAGVRAENAGGRLRQEAEPQAPAGTRKQKREWTQLDRYRRLIKERMTALGVYKPQYAALIERTAKLYVKLAALEKKYESSGMEPYIEYTNKAGHTNLVPNPVIKSIEDAYAELMLHERELGLTPAAMRKMGAAAEAPKEKSPLEAALEKLSGG